MRKSLLMLMVFVCSCAMISCSNKTKNSNDTKQEVEKIADIKGLAVIDNVEHFIAQINTIGTVTEEKKEDDSYTYHFKAPEDNNQPYISAIVVHHYDGQIEAIEVFYENATTSNLDEMIKKKYGVTEKTSVSVDDSMFGSLYGYKIGKTIIDTDYFSGITYINYKNYEIVKKHKNDEKQNEQKGLEGNI